MSDKTGWTSSEAVDFDDIPDEAPGQLPVGVYEVEIAKATAEATNSGHPAINLELTVLAPAGGGELGYVSKTIRFESVVWTDNAKFRFKQFVNAFNLPKIKSTAFGEFEELANAAVGAKGFARVLHRQNKAKTASFPVVGAYLTAAQAAEQAATGAATGAPKRPPARSRKTAEKAA